MLILTNTKCIKMDSTTHINSLPHELLAYIGTYFDIETQTRAMATCTLWNKIFGDQSAWKHFCPGFENEDYRELTCLKHVLKLVNTRHELREIIPFDLKKIKKVASQISYLSGGSDIAEVTLKTLFGPRLYDAIPDIKDLSKDEYQFNSSLPENVLFPYADESLIKLKSEQHPMIKGELPGVLSSNFRFMVIQFTVDDVEVEGQHYDEYTGSIIFEIFSSSRGSFIVMDIPQFHIIDINRMDSGQIKEDIMELMRKLVHHKQIELTPHTQYLQDDLLKGVPRTYRLGLTKLSKTG